MVGFFLLSSFVSVASNKADPFFRMYSFLRPFKHVKKTVAENHTKQI